MDEKGRKVAANAIKDALKEKYPPAKKGGVNTVASAKAVAKAMQNHPFENADAPVLAELVAVGKEMGVEPCDLHGDGAAAQQGNRLYGYRRQSDL